MRYFHTSLRSVENIRSSTLLIGSTAPLSTVIKNTQRKLDIFDHAESKGFELGGSPLTHNVEKYRDL